MNETLLLWSDEVAYQRCVFITGCVTTVPVMTEQISSQLYTPHIVRLDAERLVSTPDRLKIYPDVRLEVLDDDLRQLRTISDTKRFVSVMPVAEQKTDTASS